MTQTFPQPITTLPEADIPINGIKAFLSLGENHQIRFMVFVEYAHLSEYAHACQWGIVLKGLIGRAEMWILKNIVLGSFRFSLITSFGFWRKVARGHFSVPGMFVFLLGVKRPVINNP